MNGSIDDEPTPARPWSGSWRVRGWLCIMDGVAKVVRQISVVHEETRGELEMTEWLRALSAAAIGLACCGAVASGAHAAGLKSAYDFDFTSIEGAALPMSAFAGKAVLVVNTASLCGFTYQYEGLQAVFERYRDRGFVVLGVPSNDFGNQEPGKEEEIKEFCEVNFNVDFPLTTKQQVKGPDAHPFFRYATEILGEDAEPRWNFHKYLVDAKGELIGSWSSRVEPGDVTITDAIEQALPGEGS